MSSPYSDLFVSVTETDNVLSGCGNVIHGTEWPIKYDLVGGSSANDGDRQRIFWVEAHGATTLPTFHELRPVNRQWPELAGVFSPVVQTFELNPCDCEQNFCMESSGSTACSTLIPACTGCTFNGSPSICQIGPHCIG